MVSTRGKKKSARSKKNLVENDAAENDLAGTLITDSLTVNVEEPKADAQLDDKVDINVDEARNEKYEEMSGEEESEKVTKVDNDDENTVVREMIGDNKVESEENTFEDDEIDDQEDILWDDDEEISEHDNEERVVDEYEVSEEEATEEDDEDDEVSEEEATQEEDGGEDEVSEEEATEEEGDEENTPQEKEIAIRNAREAKAKEDGREAEEHNIEKLEVSLKNIKKSSERNKKKKVRADRLKKVDSRDKPEPSRKRKAKKRVESMGMIFMCSSKTKKDCYQYRVLGLPESKKDIVEKIYTGMRLFLYDVDLKLMYGIYKAVGPGGYNIEPKAFKSQFPSQVRFKVLDNCLPLAEEKFKKVIEDNYFTKTKFDCQLNSEQVKKLCKLFIASSKGRPSKKLGRSRKVEKHPVRRERARRHRAGDERRLPLREEVQYHERPRKRPRKIISRPAAPLRQRLPAPLPSTVPSSYVYERTSDVDAYRRDPYLERHGSYRDRRDRLLNFRDPYGDGRDPPIDRNDHYREGRDPYLERHYAYRDGRDPYIERRDPYRDDRDPYPRRRDPYRDGRDSYLELRDLYRDGQDPDRERHDSYRDGRDSYLERRVPYRDSTHSELYSTYRRDPLSDRRDVYREDRGVEYRDSYRRDERLERRDLDPLNLETRKRDDIFSRDYVSNRERPSYAEPIYSAEYPSRAGLARSYRL